MAWFTGCKTKHICPAYQSAFYLDSKIADEQFSPFDKDSMPKMEDLVKKTDVLTIIRLGKKKIDKRMAVIPMITIFPEVADSAIAMADSLAADSLYSEEPEEVEPEEGDTGEEIAPADDTAEKQEQPAKEAEEEEAEVPKPKRKKEVDEESENFNLEPKKKSAKKSDLKDPELSDPSLKAEFEESFDLEPKDDEDMPSFQEEEIEPPKPEKKKRAKAAKKANPKPQVQPKPASEPEEDDKF